MSTLNVQWTSFIWEKGAQKVKSGNFPNLPWTPPHPPCLVKTLPEVQRTQDIESKTWIISKSWNKCRFQFSTLSLPPLLGNHLSHLVHLPVILLAHHHLNENRYLPMHCSNNIYCRQNDHSSPAPIFHATPVPPPCRPPWWSPPSKWQPSTSNCPIGIIS